MAHVDSIRPLARDAMAYVLAGGRGSRLMELTDKRAKPAVYFGGKSRIIDFALSNALNSGIRRIGVATQYKAHSLIRHLQRGWNFFRPERNESFDILPASQRVSETMWYAGTADAVYQNIDIIESYAPEYIVILAGDHVYKMDYEPMLRQHVESAADVTVGCIEVPRMEATGFGVMAIDETDRIMSFLEKPKDPPGMPDKPDMALASMGIYVFETHFLIDQLRRDAADPNSSRDFGKDIIPYLVKHGKGASPTASRAPAFARPRRRRSIGATSARSTPIGKPTSTSPTPVPALDLYDRELADLDLWRDHAAGQVRARRRRPPRHGGRLARLRRLHHFRLGPVPLAALHRRARPLLLQDRGRGDPALRRYRPRRAALEGGRRPRRAHPRRACRRRGSRTRRAALPAAASAASA